MPKNNSRDRRDLRKIGAEERQEAHNKRSIAMQIDRVLNRTGARGSGLATKELNKLFAAKD